jgi:hypothetical protein
VELFFGVWFSFGFNAQQLPSGQEGGALAVFRLITSDLRYLLHRQIGRPNPK